MSQPIRVLIAHEHSLFRDALRAALEQEGMFVVAEVRDGARAVAEVERARPDIALLDADLPNRDGIKATADIRSAAPGCHVIVLADQEDEQQLLAAVEAGARGYLTNGQPLHELIEATRAVASGRMVLPPMMLAPLITTLVRRRATTESARRRAARLTKREKQVLALVTDGANNDRIAQALVISPQTARTHVHNILDKLGTRSRLEAAAFVRQNRIMDELILEDG